MPNLNRQCRFDFRIFAFRGYRFVQPPVIESLCTQHSRNVMQSIVRLSSVVSLSEGIALLNPRLLNRYRSPVLRTLHRQMDICNIF